MLPMGSNGDPCPGTKARSCGTATATLGQVRGVPQTPGYAGCLCLAGRARAFVTSTCAPERPWWWSASTRSAGGRMRSELLLGYLVFIYAGSAWAQEPRTPLEPPEAVVAAL